VPFSYSCKFRVAKAYEENSKRDNFYKPFNLVISQSSKLFKETAELRLFISFLQPKKLMMLRDSEICAKSNGFTISIKNLSQNLQEDLMTQTIISDMRMELSECEDEVFLERLIIKWRLASDYSNVCRALMIYLAVPIPVVSNEKCFHPIISF
jgi:hypothetical protein